MTLEMIVERLMQMSDDTTPCECGIPCKYRDCSLKYAYCENGDCLEGIATTVREITRKEMKNAD